MKEITITISGEPSTGKSTVAGLIRDVLKDYGVTDVIVVEFDKEPPLSTQKVLKSMHNIGKLLKVKIQTEQIKNFR